MSKSRLFSGKVKKITGANLDAARHEFLDVSQAEPDLGIPAQDSSVLVGDTTGTRTWTALSDITAGYATTAGTADFATTSGYTQSFDTSTLVLQSVNAGNASTADFATTSGYTQSFDTSTLVAQAVDAITAQYANNAGSADTVAGGYVSDITAGNDITVSNNTGSVQIDFVNNTGYITTGNFAYITADLVPSEDLTYNLGSPEKQWASLYVGTATIHIANNTVSVNEYGALTVNSTAVVSVINVQGNGLKTEFDTLTDQIQFLVHYLGH